MNPFLEELNKRKTENPFQKELQSRSPVERVDPSYEDLKSMGFTIDPEPPIAGMENETLKEKSIRQMIQKARNGDSQALEVLQKNKISLPTPKSDMMDNIPLEQQKKVYEVYGRQQDKAAPEDQVFGLSSLDPRMTYKGAVVPPPTDNPISRVQYKFNSGVLDGVFEFAETVGSLFDIAVRPVQDVVNAGLGTDYKMNTGEAISRSTGRLQPGSGVDEFITEGGRNVPAVVTALFTGPASTMSGKLAQGAMIEAISTASTDEYQDLGVSRSITEYIAPDLMEDLQSGDDVAVKKAIVKLGMLADYGAIGGAMAGAGKLVGMGGRLVKRGVSDPLKAFFSEEGAKEAVDAAFLRDVLEPTMKLPRDQKEKVYEALFVSLKTYGDPQYLSKISKDSPVDLDIANDTYTTIFEGLRELSTNERYSDISDTLGLISDRALKMRKSTAITSTGLDQMDEITANRLAKPSAVLGESSDLFEDSAKLPGAIKQTDTGISDKLSKDIIDPGEQAIRETSDKVLTGVEKTTDIGPGISSVRKGVDPNDMLEKSYSSTVDIIYRIEDDLQKEVTERYNIVKSMIGTEPVSDELKVGFKDVGVKANIETYSDALNNIKELKRIAKRVSTSPEKREYISTIIEDIRTTELDDIINSIDAPEVKQALNEAQTFYRDQYASRFRNSSGTTPVGLAKMSKDRGFRDPVPGSATELSQKAGGRRTLKQSFNKESNDNIGQSIYEVINKYGTPEDKAVVDQIPVGEALRSLRDAMDVGDWNIEDPKTTSALVNTLREYRDRVTNPERKTEIDQVLSVLQSEYKNITQFRELLDTQIKRSDELKKRFRQDIISDFINKYDFDTVTDISKGNLKDGVTLSSKPLSQQLDTFFDKGADVTDTLVKKMEEVLAPEELAIAKSSLKSSWLESVSRKITDKSGSFDSTQYSSQFEKMIASGEKIFTSEQDKVLFDSVKTIIDRIGKVETQLTSGSVKAITPTAAVYLGKHVQGEAQGSMNKIISFTVGVLNPLATKLRQGSSVMAKTLTPDDFFKAYLDRLASDPEYFATRLAKALNEEKTSKTSLRKSFNTIFRPFLKGWVKSVSPDYESFSDKELEALLNQVEMEQNLKDKPKEPLELTVRPNDKK